MQEEATDKSFSFQVVLFRKYKKTTINVLSTLCVLAVNFCTQLFWPLIIILIRMKNNLQFQKDNFNVHSKKGKILANEISNKQTTDVFFRQLQTKLLQWRKITQQTVFRIYKEISPKSGWAIVCAILVSQALGCIREQTALQTGSYPISPNKSVLVKNKGERKK